ncbi:diguanylate cyclase [Thermotoga sp. KOL6]|uniref:diguanylate cyclase n=1 Tax=Thermotoga sp. KOL6 TaxID=126741 RepID=UPI000C769214|nr:diguanylate cyclase [Thermotoga sp. KOL6]PLV59196.1 diguanylate cyclase [Thermotoga sp. KOL6]
MKVRIEVEDSKLKRRLEKLLREEGFLIKEPADLVVSDNIKDYVEPLIMIAEIVPENVPEVVLDVVDPRLPDSLLKKRFKMIRTYLKFPNGILSYLEEEFEKSKRYNFPLSVVYLSFEDEATAKRVYEILEESLRASDRFDFVRKNELILILPGTPKEGAERVLKRLKRRLLRINWTKQVSLEHSWAQVEDWMDSIEDLLMALETSTRRLGIT